MKKKILSVVIVVALMSVFVAAYSIPAKAAEPTPKKLKIGFNQALSGTASTWSLPMLYGLEIVRDDINDKGGIKIGKDTYLIEIFAEDNHFTSEGAAAAANRLLEKDIDIAVASLVTHTTLSSQAVFEPANIITINVAYDDRVITEANLSYRLTFAPSMLIPPQLGWIASAHPEVKRFAEINANTESGWFSDKRIKEYMPKVPFELVSAEFYEPGTTDFYPILTKILAQKPDVIYSTEAPPTEWALIHKQARELGYEGLFIYASPIPEAELKEIAGTKVSEGSIGTDYAVSGPNASDAAKAFKKLYEERYGTYAGLSLRMAAPMYAVLQAMQDCGSIETAKVKAELERGKKYQIDVLSGEGFFGGKEIFGRDAQWYGTLWITEMQKGKSIPIYAIPVENLKYKWPK